jgi:hypothetical protein
MLTSAETTGITFFAKELIVTPQSIYTTEGLDAHTLCLDYDGKG